MAIVQKAATVVLFYLRVRHPRWPSFACAPPFTGLGVGYGLNDERTMRLEQFWMAWLKKANADMDRVRLLRHF